MNRSASVNERIDFLILISFKSPNVVLSSFHGWVLSGCKPLIEQKTINWIILKINLIVCYAIFCYDDYFKTFVIHLCDIIHNDSTDCFSQQ